MGNTPRLNIPYPEQGSFNDVPADILKVAVLMDELMTVALQGERSQRPPAAKYGRLYWSTNLQELSYDDGTQWWDIPRNVRWVRFIGMTNPSGEGLAAHGITALHLRVISATAFYKGPSGEAIPMQVRSIDGTDIWVHNPANPGAAAGKGFYVVVQYNTGLPTVSW